MASIFSKETKSENGFFFFLFRSIDSKTSPPDTPSARPLKKFLMPQ